MSNVLVTVTVTYVDCFKANPRGKTNRERERESQTESLNRERCSTLYSGYGIIADVVSYHPREHRTEASGC